MTRNRRQIAFITLTNYYHQILPKHKTHAIQNYALVLVLALRVLLRLRKSRGMGSRGALGRRGEVLYNSIRHADTKRAQVHIYTSVAPEHKTQHHHHNNELSQI